MSNLVPWNSHPVSRRDSRPFGRELARMQQETFLQEVRMRAVAHVGGVAMDAVADLTMYAEQQSQMVPAAAGRINAIADAVTMEALSIVRDTRYRLSR